VCAGKVLFQNPKRVHAYNLCLKRKKAEKESFAEAVLLPRKLLVGELKTNSKHGASVEGLVMMYDLFVRLFVSGNPCFYGFFDSL
jgi:hypothetical protein